jgi:polyhydroxyalkanoate synthase
MLTGRAARRTTWQVLDEWFTQWASDRADSGTVEAPATVPAAPPAEKKPSRDAIGANPNRRYGSGGSRSLAR